MKSGDLRPEQSTAVEALMREVQNLDSSAFPALHALAENELSRLRGGICDSLDVVNNRHVKIRARVEVPQSHFSGINFVGRLLGPGGKKLRAVQDETKTKMAILGAGSLRDDSKEKELLSNGDPKFQHLKQKLHLQVDSLGPPSEAYYRLAHALSELRKIMTPEPVDGMPNSQQTTQQKQANPLWIPSQQNQVPNPLGISRGPLHGRGIRSVMRLPCPGSEQFSKPTPGLSFRGRGKQWVGRCGVVSANGFNNVTPTMPIGPETYPSDANSMGYTNMQIYDQSDFNGTTYEDFGATYGQNDNWGKVGMPDVRGRGRAHPYSRPGIKFDQH